MSNTTDYTVKIKNKNDNRHETDLGIRFFPGNSLPFIVIDDTMLDDLGIEETGTLDTNFNKELYRPDKDYGVYTNIVNVMLDRYGYKIRLIHDDVNDKFFFTYNIDYIPLLNTIRRSEIIPKYILGGLKDSRRLDINNQILDHSLVTSSNRYDDISYFKPNANISDFKLYSLNLRGIMNPVKSRVKVINVTAPVPNMSRYYETNEIYFLRVDKDNVLGNDTDPHVYSLLPVSGNKFSINYIGRTKDVDYLYIPIIL